MRGAIILASLVMVGVAAFVWRANEKVEDCPTTMEYNGVRYVVHHMSEDVATNNLGVGTERGCGDKGPWTEDVAVSRVAGVDQRSALATPAAVGVLYVAEGVTVDDLPRDVAELVEP